MATYRPKKLTIALAIAVTASAIGVGTLFTLNTFAGPGHAAPSDDATPLAVTFDGTKYFDGTEPHAEAATHLRRDPEEKYASPEAADARPHRIADMPAASTTTRPASGETTKELRAALDGQGRAGDRVTLAADGSAVPPIGAPDAVVSVINAGNAIRSFPYIWGGGHGSFQDRGYDCSGSVSYALAAAGLVSRPMVSGEFENWGVPGKGKWITIYANDGHMFMVVGGLRFDTSFRDGPRGSRWQDDPRPMKGFAVRHWPGL